MARSYVGERWEGTGASWGILLAWTGVAIMWGFWALFVVFLADPPGMRSWWPFPTVTQGGIGLQPLAAAAVDAGLIALFGLQHSLMARAWFKRRVLARLARPFERVMFVHAANACLYALILFWQPVAGDIWHFTGAAAAGLWVAFAAGFVLLLFGALSYGILDLLGVSQMQDWHAGRTPRAKKLRTGRLYAWFRHPMYVGLVLALWSTPHMTVGHLLLSAGLTVYVLIGIHYEERDLATEFGTAYARYRARDVPISGGGGDPSPH